MPSSGSANERKSQKLQMEELLWKKVWSVNADDIEWVECEHVNKTNLISQLELQINELKQQLELPQNNNESKIQTAKSKLEDLNNKLSKELIGCRFKLEPEQFSPEVTVKHYQTSSKKLPSDVK